MLTETFIASIQSGPKSAAHTSLPKDASIFLHDFQPLPSLKGALKKSSTNAHCLAATSTHIFAAQSDKALIHVYNREKGNQETIVPFPFRVTSLVRVGAADGAAVLALGTENGGLLLWELCTGRLVSTEPSHLQAVTCLAVDPTYTYLLSGSADSSIQVWSVPGLLSFTDPGFGDATQASRTSPKLHISTHRGAITSISTGHSHTNADFALSTSEDKTCLVWNYRTGEILHTFLVPETPLCAALDPADRGFYTGLSDGSVQFVNFHKAGSSTHLLYDRNLTDTPTQAAESDRWQSMTPVGAPLSISVSYDGSRVLTGHDNGKVMSWEIGLPPTEISDLGQPVTNLMIVSPTGFPNERKDAAGVKQLTVVKPKPDAFQHLNGSGLSVPQTYSFSAVFAESIPIPRFSDEDGDDFLTKDFEAAICDEYFSEKLLRDAIEELSGPVSLPGAKTAMNSADAEGETDQQEVAQLKVQLKIAELQRHHIAEKLLEANKEIEKRDGLARMKQRAKNAKQEQGATRRQNQRKKDMGKKLPTEDRGGGLSEDSDELMGRN